MTTTPRSPRLLLLSTVLLSVVGVAVLGVPHGQEQPVPAPRPHATTAPPAAATVPPAAEPTANADGPTTSAASTLSSVESALPPHGEGAAGDPAVQRNLETSWPADLPSIDERELLATGRALLRADATGIGRAKWPAVFPASAQAVAPAFAPAGFRIQAAIARRDGGPDKALVHLVWAGMDRGGTFTDLRITDWYFIRTLKKGAPTWTPQPRT
ncbi:hypothetical protein PV415_29925 [Streptomyces sp. ME03-5684b]|uniref:hypothetical protein n=1 Tax=Streptomyces sp. ME03-5684b TaxID=3028681 RepID=UPI0029A422D1|nr:hypothetical protein [Streptomyces sp. ME03-5684b]MDX3321132.1 hypothetical protein [Streptomyces sp. ME03-5684b]